MACSVTSMSEGLALGRLFQRGSTGIGSGAKDWGEEADEGGEWVLVGFPFYEFWFARFSAVLEFGSGEGHVGDVLYGCIGSSIFTGH